MMKVSDRRPENREALIDAAKGIGILCVFLGHLVPYDSPVFRVIFNFHMPLFFFLSGMLFDPLRDTEPHAMLRRVWRTIGIPAVFFTLLGTVICVLTGQFLRNNLMDWVRVGASFFHGSPEYGGSIWFLTCLADAHIAFWFWCRYRQGKDNRFATPLFILSMYVLGFVGGTCIHPKILLGTPLMICSAPMAIVYYALGYYLKNRLRNILAALQARRLIPLVVATLLLAIEIPISLCDCSPNLAIPEFHAFFAFPVASALGIAAILSVAASPIAGTALRFVGRFSLYYFLLERWSQATWMALCKTSFPSLLPAATTANTNVTEFSALQIAIFMTFIVISETAVIPLLKPLLCQCKRRFG